MKRYQIWDEISPVITPSGAVFTAEQWMNKFPMAKLPQIKLVIGGGTINGSVCMEYTSMIDRYEKQGCDFSSCVTKQDHLDAIEAFEDQINTPSNTPSTDERIAAALEAQVMMALPDEEV